MENKIELLAPAGSFEGLRAVIAAGADAVYIGGARFGARAYAENPEEDLLLEAIDYAHLRGVKVYLTVNTCVKEEEMKEVLPFITPYVRQGADAVLVQDFGVLTLLHEHFPELPLHASTQMTVTGAHAAKLLAGYGVTRIVPARELSFSEIRKIKEESSLEVETFVHGALCFCYSGQCLLSSLLGGRSGNRGRCAQPCRLPYDLGDGQKAYLSPKDLCAVKLLPQIIDAGVTSLKIEGRMKAPEYAAGVTAVYRRALDRYGKDPGHFSVSQKDMQTLFDLYNRSGFTDGYYARHNGPDMMASDLKELEVKTSRGQKDVYEQMHEAYIAHGKNVPVTGTCTVRAGDPVMVTVTCGELTGCAFGMTAEEAKKQPLGEERISENIRKTGGSGFEFTDLCTDTDGRSFVPISALNEVRRQAVEDLREKMLEPFRRKTADAPEPSAKKMGGKEETAAEKIKDRGAKSSGSRRPASFSLSASVETAEQFRALLDIAAVRTLYVPIPMLLDERACLSPACLQDMLRQAKEHGKAVFLALPYVERDESSQGPGHCELREIINRARELCDTGLDGFLVRSLESFARMKEAGMLSRCVIDAGLYTWNRRAKDFFRDEGVLRDTAPYELNEKELYGRDNTGSEIVLYGRLPLMVTAQCIRKNTSGCLKMKKVHSDLVPVNSVNARKVHSDLVPVNSNLVPVNGAAAGSGQLMLTDRTGRQFPVKNECVFCYNVLYNSVPLNLFDEMSAVRAMGFAFGRLSFTDESGARCRSIAENCAEALGSERKIKTDEEHTKGHFSRGVL